MGWVTLTLRKRELKQSHAYYQLRDLQISREKRQLARRKQYETASIQNQQEQALMPIKEGYRKNRQSIMDQISDLREQKKAANESETESTKDYDGEISSLQMELSNYQLEYTGQVDSTKTIYEGELAMIEEEASDQETQLDMEQTEVEAQMEAISQEIQAVSEAVSSEIQNSTIKLA